MALLLETTLGDLVIDLDVEGSPSLCKNMLQLAESRFYTQTLIYNIQANRFCQLGDPHGDGTGGACYQAILEGEDVTKSSKRFLKSLGRRLTHAECQERGRVVATEMKGIPDTIGSQFLITLAAGPGMSLDGYTVVEDEGKKASETHDTFVSLGRVTEDDDNVLQQLATLYCDADGRPFVDVRIKRALVIHNPFEEDNSEQQSTELKNLMKRRGVQWDDEEDRIMASPEYDRPLDERVKPRIAADQVELLDDEDDEALEKLQKKQQEEGEKHDAKSRAVVLEMLGDLPDADIRAPENVLFVCKLNPVTEDEDLELIFSRFDNNVKAEIIRDQDTGVSLQYAFIEFTENKQAEEAYFKMNNALVDDRRIKVDFSQSVAKIWDRFNQKLKPTALQHGDFGGGRGGGGRGGGRGTGGRGGRGRGMDFRGGGRGGDRFQGGRGRQDSHRNSNHPHPGQSQHSIHPHSQSRRDSGGGGSRDRERQGHNKPQTGRDSKRDGPRGSRLDQGRVVNDSGSTRRPSLDEFGRVRVQSEGKINDDNQQRDRRSVSPPRERRRDHRRSPSRSRSRDRGDSPDRRRHSHRRSRSHSDESDRRSRKHHKSSRQNKKKKKHRHHNDDDRRHRRVYDSDEDSRTSAGDGKRSSKRRYSEDETEGQKRRKDNDAPEDRHPRKHSQHHKRRKRSCSR